ncbi:MAG: hypothetical protein HKL82_03470 [Acidimicrobiaceae bacterium]|nr:hypothetical protein [Acidimicrobiaceae bacterium]
MTIGGQMFPANFDQNANGKPNRRRWAATATLIAGSALILSACGSSTSAVSSSTPTTVVAGSSSNSGTTLSGTGLKRRRGFGVFGQLTALAGSAMTIRSNSTTTTVQYNGNTKFTERVAATASDITVGECINVRGTTNTTGVVAANTITLTQPTSGGCLTRRGPGGGGLGGSAAGGGVASGFAGRGAPSAVGVVASISSGLIEVQNATAQTSVTYSASTVLFKQEAVPPSALALGECVSALFGFGPKSTTTTTTAGPKAALVVSISEPINGVCPARPGFAATGSAA